MDTLFVAEAREAAAFLEAYEATLTPDPLPNPLSRPTTPVEAEYVRPPAVAKVRPMPRPDQQPEHGYFIAYRNPNGSFLSLLKKQTFLFRFTRLTDIAFFSVS